MHRVVVYTTVYCGYCYALKSLLDRKHIAYEEIDVTGDGERRAWLRSATGRHTVPQIFIDDRPYGGFTDVAQLDRTGELDRILESATV
jgi:glutaredoxin 3